MMIDRLLRPLNLVLGSVFLLASALFFEFIIQLAPCALCYTQRLPHYALIALGAVALLLKIPQRALAAAGAVLTASALSVAAYHSGVELKLFEGPTKCTSNSVSSLSSDDLFAAVMQAPIVRCDDIAWQFLGLSMATWHAIFCVMLLAGWIRLFIQPNYR